MTRVAVGLQDITPSLEPLQNGMQTIKWQLIHLLSLSIFKWKLVIFHSSMAQRKHVHWQRGNRRHTDTTFLEWLNIGLTAMTFPRPNLRIVV